MAAITSARMIDLIALRADWLEEALNKPRMGPDGQPYIDLPWLVLLKLAASRSQDLADLSRMLGAAGDADLERIRDIVKKFGPTDAQDVESLIRMGRLEADQGRKDDPENRLT